MVSLQEQQENAVTGIEGARGRVAGGEVIVKAGTCHAHDFEASRTSRAELWTKQAAPPVTLVLKTKVERLLI